jgi:LAS superfamily LD-carboxypeptidase LdcB
MELIYLLIAAIAVYAAYSATHPDGEEPSSPLPSDSMTPAKAYVNGVAHDIALSDIGNGMMLRSDAAVAFLQMSAALQAETGKSFTVNSAFRSMAQQEQLYATLGPTIAAQPGYSPHQNGVAADINFINPNKPEYDSDIANWLDANAETYGWKRTGLGFYNPEPWHLDYVGA